MTRHLKTPGSCAKPYMTNPGSFQLMDVKMQASIFEMIV
jgi:hypothetical protein